MGMPGIVGRGNLLVDYTGLGELRFDEKVAHRAGDIGFQFAALVSLKDGGCQFLELRIVDVGYHDSSLSLI